MIKVMKFGGTSVGRVDAMERTADIIKQRTGQQGRGRLGDVRGHQHASSPCMRERSADRRTHRCASCGQRHLGSRQGHHGQRSVTGDMLSRCDNSVDGLRDGAARPISRSPPTRVLVLRHHLLVGREAVLAHHGPHTPVPGSGRRGHDLGGGGHRGRRVPGQRLGRPRQHRASISRPGCLPLLGRGRTPVLTGLLRLRRHRPSAHLREGRFRLLRLGGRLRSGRRLVRDLDRCRRVHDRRPAGRTGGQCTSRRWTTTRRPSWPTSAPRCCIPAPSNRSRKKCIPVMVKNTFNPEGKGTKIHEIRITGDEHAAQRGGQVRPVHRQGLLVARSSTSPA